jgi:hypothetical protein
MEKMGATSLADLLAMAARIGIHTPLQAWRLHCSQICKNCEQ